MLLCHVYHYLCWQPSTACQGDDFLRQSDVAMELVYTSTHLMEVQFEGETGFGNAVFRGSLHLATSLLSISCRLMPADCTASTCFGLLSNPCHQGRRSAYKSAASAASPHYVTSEILIKSAASGASPPHQLTRHSQFCNSFGCNRRQKRRKMTLHIIGCVVSVPSQMQCCVKVST